MKHPSSDPLLRELLSGDDLASFRQASLDHALTALHRRRQRQRALCLGLLGALPLLLAMAVLFRQSEGFRSLFAAHSAVSPAPPSAQAHGVKFITDEQLFALFPGRSVALVGHPGHQQLVFLDHPAPATKPASAARP